MSGSASDARRGSGGGPRGPRTPGMRKAAALTTWSTLHDVHACVGLEHRPPNGMNGFIGVVVTAFAASAPARRLRPARRARTSSERA